MLSSLLSVAALLGPALAVVQPLNTTILGPYGHVPPVYPSRVCFQFHCNRLQLT